MTTDCSYGSGAPTGALLSYVRSSEVPAKWTAVSFEAEVCTPACPGGRGTKVACKLGCRGFSIAAAIRFPAMVEAVIMILNAT